MPKVIDNEPDISEQILTAEEAESLHKYQRGISEKERRANMIKRRPLIARLDEQLRLLKTVMPRGVSRGKISTERKVLSAVQSADHLTLRRQFHKIYP